jgi:hypothetical protein
MLYLVTKTVEAYVMADDEMDAEDFARWQLDDEGCDVEVNAIPANTALIPDRWLGALPFSDDEKEQRTIRQIIAQDDMVRYK